MRLNLPASLVRMLSSTNLIKDLFSRVLDAAQWSNGGETSEADRGWRRRVIYLLAL